MIGPTAQGIGELIDADPNAEWDPTANGGRGGVVNWDQAQYGPNWMDSPRVVKIALFPPGELDGSGMQTIKFNDFALMFIEESGQPAGARNGRFIRRPPVRVAGPPPVPWSSSCGSESKERVLVLRLRADLSRRSISAPGRRTGAPPGCAPARRPRSHQFADELPREAVSQILSADPQVAFIDLGDASTTGLRVMKVLSQDAPDMTLIVAGPALGAEALLEVMRSGAARSTSRVPWTPKTSRRPSSASGGAWHHRRPRRRPPAAA